MLRPSARPKYVASAFGPSIAAISAKSGFKGSMPRASTAFSSMKLVYMAASLSVILQSRIACTSACAFSNSMMPTPALAYSAGNGVFASQVPFTNRNRSSCGRTFLSIAVGSMPEASGAAAVSARAAPANERHRKAGSSLRRDIPDLQSGRARIIGQRFASRVPARDQAWLRRDRP